MFLGIAMGFLHFFVGLIVVSLLRGSGLWHYVGMGWLMPIGVIAHKLGIEPGYGVIALNSAFCGLVLAWLVSLVLPYNRE